MVKYILTGATGGLGSQIFKHFIRLAPASDIVVSLHNPSGATPEITQSGVEVRKGDFSHPETLESAFAGGDKLLLLSCPTITPETCLANHIAAIDAAKRAGIQHVYYTSLIYPDDTKAFIMRAHWDTEKYLKQSGLTYTIIREGIYSESYPLYFGFWNPSRGSEVKVPYGDGGIAWVSREDLGEGTARVLASDAYADQTIRFTGSKIWTLSELAELITTILKLEPPLKISIVSLEEYKNNNKGGEDLLTKWATTFPALQSGELAVVDPLLKEILGRDLKPFEETVKGMLDAPGIAGDLESATRQYSK